METIVISASSDIGAAACRRWARRGWSVYGTYRIPSPKTADLEANGVTLTSCDLACTGSVLKACRTLRKACRRWDVLMLASGSLDPVGPFARCDFTEWEESVRVNFTAQLRILHELLQSRSSDVRQPCVIFFAGGGTNNAVINYSAYTVSKIALIKMCELLDAEISDTRFAIVGPGWVRTKIHESTLRAESRAGSNYDRTIEMLSGNQCTSVERVIDCCDWIIDSDREIVSGRNFSVVYDAWGTERLSRLLSTNRDLYKLRRYGNKFLPHGRSQEE
jgi:NAD(P)-dependent dehydrogenase (short-subunit alcohol dehydrogenase family)